ncbi:LDCC motif putative metal-binding protein [Peptoclostridium litorale]|nr:LDCC motif putative metal-binding protein [Peptoclostridium litorale]
MKKWFENFLKKLEKANKKSLGSERLDCCRLNSQNPSQSK